MLLFLRYLSNSSYVMSYEIIVHRSKKKIVEKILSYLSSEDRQEVRTILCTSPKGSPNTHTIIKKVHSQLWQYDVPGNKGYRFIYGVSSKPRKEVHIIFAGNHDDASTFLRRKNKHVKKLVR